jgi:hypothetical protein
MIIVYDGLPGAGKTAKLADLGLSLLEKNRRIHKKYGHIRQVAANIKFSTDVEKKYSLYIRYWSELTELIDLRDVDILIDEVAVYFDAQEWALLPASAKRFLRQHRKRGIDIYATTQSFDTVDISMRRLTDQLCSVSRIFGSRTPSPTRPQSKNPFCLSIIREVDTKSFADQRNDYKYVGLPTIELFTKASIFAFDTTQEIKTSEYPPLRHIERVCPDCGFTKVVHS